MNGELFNKYWAANYPEAYPINYELKLVYPDKWLRIHSLPESKRYAETDEEYQIILNRQNNLINDLIGDGTKVIISFGLYTDDVNNENYSEFTDFGEFVKVQKIALHKIKPEEYVDEMYFDVYIKNDIWRRESKNKILRAIADDQIRTMFICPSKSCIIAPYDGGVDIIVNSSEKRRNLKVQYKDWLSKREDGL